MTTLQLLGQMMRLPLSMFTLSVEVFARTMQGFQGMMSASAPQTGGGVEQWPYRQGYPYGPTPTAQCLGGAPRPTQEIDGMANQDLSGDRLKIVHYTIYFTKRDYEKKLKEGEEVVNYPTDGASFGAQKIAQFWRDLTDKGITTVAQIRQEIPGWESQEDARYIAFDFNVRYTRDREEADYDKQQVQVLREIRDKI